MEKKSYDNVMFSAMADELGHIHKEKVAINMQPVMGALSGLAGRAAAAAPRALSALEGAGGHVVRGLESAGRAGMGAGSQIAQRAGQGVISGLNTAEGALGGARNLNRAAGVGAAALGTAGALGAAGVARRAVAGPQPTQVVVR